MPVQSGMKPLLEKPEGLLDGGTQTGRHQSEEAQSVMPASSAGRNGWVAAVQGWLQSMRSKLVEQEKGWAPLFCPVAGSHGAVERDNIRFRDQAEHQPQSHLPLAYLGTGAHYRIARHGVDLQSPVRHLGE